MPNWIYITVLWCLPSTMNNYIYVWDTRSSIAKQRQALCESGALHDVLYLHDVLARVFLARLCHTLSTARALDGEHTSKIFLQIPFKLICMHLSFDVWCLKSYLNAEMPDSKSQFTHLLYQLLLDPSERVCFEALLCLLGKFDNTDR